MTSRTIDTTMARRMVDTAVICGASIIGQPGGWLVMLKVGTTETPLGTHRTNKPRLWRSLNRCVDYVRSELHIARFDLLDATNHRAETIEGTARHASAERMRQLNAAAAHDTWFRQQVADSLKEADDPTTPWVPHDVVKADMAAQRVELKARIAKAK